MSNHECSKSDSNFGYYSNHGQRSLATVVDIQSLWPNGTCRNCSRVVWVKNVDISPERMKHEIATASFYLFCAEHGTIGEAVKRQRLNLIAWAFKFSKVLNSTLAY